MAGEARLQLNAKQWSQQDNWIEFQDWHLQNLENVEKERDEFKKELDEVRRKAEDIQNPESKRAAEDVDAILRDVEYAERKVNRQRILLQWTEHERRATDTAYPTLIDDEKSGHEPSPKTDRRSYTRGHPIRQAETVTVLGKGQDLQGQAEEAEQARQEPEAPQFRN